MLIQIHSERCVNPRLRPSPTLVCGPCPSTTSTLPAEDVGEGNNADPDENVNKEDAVPPQPQNDVGLDALQPTDTDPNQVVIPLLVANSKVDYGCFLEQVEDIAQCGVEPVTCGTEFVVDGAKCGFETVQDAG